MASNASQTITAIQSPPATASSQRMMLGCRRDRRRRSVGPAARGDVPHRLHAEAAHAPHAVVEVDRRVAVGREELDALAQPGRTRGVGDRQRAVLVAREPVLAAGALDGLRRKGLVGRKRLQSTVHHRAIGRRHAHHRRGHRQRHLEFRHGVAGAAADAAIVEVHHAVGAALQLGEPAQLDVDVVRARRAAGDDLHRQPVGFEARARVHQRRHRRARRLAELRARDADRAGGDLLVRDLGAAMGLGVRPELLAGRAHVLGHALEIALEAIHVEQERGRRNLVARHRESEPSTDLTRSTPFTRLRWIMPGRPFLQIPGPTLVPERVMRAMAQAVIDHRGPTFGALVHDCLAGLKDVFQTTRGQIVLYPGSGTGAWEAALVNTLSPGDRALACVNGHFSTGFAKTAAAYGIEVERLEVASGEGGPADRVGERLAAGTAARPRAVLVVHNETSTGVTSGVAAVRAALDGSGHPALLLVDTVSSLASIDFKFDAWGVDVALTGPQKGLMLPPGMAILAVSERALTASEKAKCPRAFWDWQPVLERNRRGEFPYTPATVLLFGLREALAILHEEGLANVFARHARLDEACRRAVQALGLAILCRKPEE